MGNPETVHPVGSAKSNARTASGSTTKSDSQESVFERLYRKPTAASIGQRISLEEREALQRTKTELRIGGTSSSARVVTTTKGGAPKMSDSARKFRNHRPKTRSNVKSPTAPELTPETAYSSRGSVDASENANVTPCSSFSASLDDHGGGDDRVEPPTPDTPDGFPMSYSPTPATGEVSSRERDEDKTRQVLLVPLSPVQYKGLWRMTWTDANESGHSESSKPVRALYLRSMSNTLYEFGVGAVEEKDVAADIITALFLRDFDQSKNWNAEDAVVVDKGDNEYAVHKVARGWDHKVAQGWATLERQPCLATVKGCVRFYHDQNEVRVQEYDSAIENLQ
jgi:hypothetical protein